MSVLHITKATFQEEVLNSDKPVLLDFWAPWCGPCRMVAPIVEEIAGEREDVLLGKVNVDEEMELAMQFGVSSIPTLVVMKGGQAVAQAVGYRPKADIEKLRQTSETVSRQDFHATVDAILNARRVFILGVRSTAPLANFLGYYLRGQKKCKDFPIPHNFVAGFRIWGHNFFVVFGI